MKSAQDDLESLQVKACKCMEYINTLQSVSHRLRSRKPLLRSSLLEEAQLRRLVDGLPSDPPRRIPAISQAMAKNITKFLKATQSSPKELAAALLQATLSSDEMQSLAHSIVWNLIDVPWNLYNLVKEMLLSNPKADSLGGMILHQMLDQEGHAFIETVLTPTLFEVVRNDSLDLTLGDPGVPNQLLRVANTCLERVIASKDLLPFPFQWLVQAFIPENTRLVSDLLLLHWIVPKFWNPSELVGSWPLSASSRANFEALATLFLKLASNSRFSAFEDSMVTVNTFLDEWDPILHKFLESIALQPPQRLCNSSSSISPLVFFPRDLNTLIRILKDHVGPLQSLAKNCSSFEMDDINAHILLDIGFPDLPDLPSSNKLLQALAVAPSLPQTELDTATLLSNEATRFLMMNKPCEAAILTSIQKLLLRESESSLDEYINEQLKDLERISQSSAVKLLVADQHVRQLEEHIKLNIGRLKDTLSQRRMRKLLLDLLPRIQHFGGQLAIRFKKMKRYACAGMSDPSKDVFVCKKCVIMSQKQLEAATIAAEDCSRVSRDGNKPGASPKEMLDFFLDFSYLNLFVWCKCEEERFSKRLERLSDICNTFQDFAELLNITAPLELSDEIIYIVAEQLKALPFLRTPRAKLACLDKSRNVLISILSVFTDGGADDFLPLLCFALLRAAPTYLLSSLNFINVYSAQLRDSKPFLDFCAAVKVLRELRIPLSDSSPLIPLLLKESCTKDEIQIAFDQLLLGMPGENIETAKEDALRFIHARRELQHLSYKGVRADEALSRANGDLEIALKLLRAV